MYTKIDLEDQPVNSSTESQTPVRRRKLLIAGSLFAIVAIVAIVTLSSVSTSSSTSTSSVSSEAAVDDTFDSDISVVWDSLSFDWGSFAWNVMTSWPNTYFPERGTLLTLYFSEPIEANYVLKVVMGHADAGYGKARFLPDDYDWIGKESRVYGTIEGSSSKSVFLGSDYGANVGSNLYNTMELCYALVNEITEDVIEFCEWDNIITLIPRSSIESKIEGGGEVIQGSEEGLGVVKVYNYAAVGKTPNPGVLLPIQGQFSDLPEDQYAESYIYEYDVATNEVGALRGTGVFTAQTSGDSWVYASIPFFSENYPADTTYVVCIATRADQWQFHWSHEQDNNPYYVMAVDEV